MMKKLVWILFVFVSVSVFAQTENKISDTVFMIRDAPIISSRSRPLYILDGQLSKVQPKFKPADICDVKVLKPFDAVKLYGKNANDGAIVIVTKEFAIERYQEKLREFSMEYKRYLDERNGDDSAIPYEINGEYLDRDLMKRIRLLYDLHPNKIKSVFFTDNYVDKGVKCVVMNIRTNN